MNAFSRFESSINISKQTQDITQQSKPTDVSKSNEDFEIVESFDEASKIKKTISELESNILSVDEKIKKIESEIKKTEDFIISNEAKMKDLEFVNETISKKIEKLNSELETNKNELSDLKKISDPKNKGREEELNFEITQLGYNIEASKEVLEENKKFPMAIKKGLDEKKELLTALKDDKAKLNEKLKNVLNYKEIREQMISIEKKLDDQSNKVNDLKKSSDLIIKTHQNDLKVISEEKQIVNTSLAQLKLELSKLNTTKEEAYSILKTKFMDPIVKIDRTTVEGEKLFQTEKVKLVNNTEVKKLKFQIESAGEKIKALKEEIEKTEDSWHQLIEELYYLEHIPDVDLTSKEEELLETLNKEFTDIQQKSTQLKHLAFPDDYKMELIKANKLLDEENIRFNNRIKSTQRELSEIQKKLDVLINKQINLLLEQKKKDFNDAEISRIEKTVIVLEAQIKKLKQEIANIENTIQNNKEQQKLVLNELNQIK